MLHQLPRTSAARYLLEMHRSPKNRGIARTLAHELQAPQPAGSERTYRKTLIDWERTRPHPGPPTFVTLVAPDGGRTLVTCRSCLSTAYYLSRHSETDSSAFTINHRCP